MSLWTQLCLLLGKNITLRKRQPVTILIEFIWPILLLLIISFIKRATPPVIKGPCYYQPLELPNGDFLSFMKSFVCMLDYKCYENSRSKDTVPYKNNLTPLYEIVTSGDNSYSVVSDLLENLKNALKDVNDLRNEPIIQKIQNGSISIIDFLNQTNQFKTKMRGYGVNDNITDAFLYSKIKIIEIYKVLNFSSKLKEKYLCNEADAVQFLRANDYFYLKNPNLTLVNNTNKTTLLSKDQIANYNMASVICKISKRQLISDVDFFSREINYGSISNYSNSIISFFTSSQFNQTVVSLTKYFTAAKSFGEDIKLFQKFSNLDEIVNLMQNSLKLLDLIQKYEQQLLFLQKIINDFSIIFDTIPEFNDIKSLVEFLVATNDLIKKFDDMFTMKSIFGINLNETFEKNLDSRFFVETSVLLNSKLSLTRTLQFILKLNTGKSFDAACKSPKLTGIFNSDFPTYIKSNLDYKLERYCDTEPDFKNLGNKILSDLNYPIIFFTIQTSLPTESLANFTKLANKLSSFNFNKFNIGSPESLIATVNSINATLDFLEKSLSDTSRLNLLNVYTFAKRLIKIFAPDFLTFQEWFYLDLFIPMLLPSLNIKTGIVVSYGRVNTNNSFPDTTSLPIIPSATSYLLRNYLINNKTDQIASESYEVDLKNSTSTPNLAVKEEYYEENDSNHGGELEYDFNIDLELKKKSYTKKSILKRNIQTTEPSYIYDNEINITTTTSSYDYSEDYSQEETTYPYEIVKTTRISPEHEALYNLLTTKAYQILNILKKTETEEKKYDLSDLVNMIGIKDNQIKSNTTITSTTKNMNSFNFDNFQSLFLTTSTKGFKPFLFNETDTNTSQNFNLANLNDLSNLSGLLGLFGQATTTTTTRSSFNFEDIGNLIPGLGGENSNNVANSNPLSILGLLNGGGTNGGSNVLSLLNLLSGGGSSANSLASIAPFLNLLPLNQLLSNPQTSIGLISSLPQIMNLIDAYTKFKFPETDGKNPNEILKQWTIFVADLRVQAINIIQILTNIGQIKSADSKLIQAILAANIETITNPDVIGKLVLACQGVNIWNVLSPDQQDLRNALNSISLIMDISEIGMNTALNFVNDSGRPFKCTNDPTNDYYTITKSLNLFDQAVKIKQLVSNKPPQLTNLNCLKIDTVYKKSLELQAAFQKDKSNSIRNKLNCLRSSIFLPFNSIIKNLQSMFDTSNADTLSILGSQLDKIADLFKLLSWATKLFQPSGGAGLLQNPFQLINLINTLPSMINDIKNMATSLSALQFIQFNNLSPNTNNMFQILDSLKNFQKEINLASKEINLFWDKYSEIINATGYASVLYDIKKGTESLGVLVDFFSQNVNGIKINQVFKNYTIISHYLQNKYGIWFNDSVEIGNSFLYYSPQKIYDTYIDSRNTYCNPERLKYFIKVKNSNYIELNDTGIDNFWVISSKFVCSLNTSGISDIATGFASDFTLPGTVKDIFLNDSSIFQKLSKNISIFTNLNASTFQMINANSTAKLDDMFQLFAGINSNYSAYNIPNIFGKSLCGPSFSLKIEDYGYTIKPAVEVPSSNMKNEENVSRVIKRMEDNKNFNDLFCSNLYSQMRTIGGKVIGNLITPLLYGKIIYTPATNLTNNIISKFNETFKQFDQLNKVLKAFSTGLNQFDDLKKSTANLSILLDNPFYQDFIELFLLQDSTLTYGNIRTFLSTLENVTALSNDWSYIGSMMTSIKSTFSCFDVNRFIAVNTEEELEKLAGKLYENGTFLIGIVFQNVNPNDKQIPPNFTVKLRTNVDNVPETSMVRPWIWLPGPSDNLFMDLRYMRGFIQMQNLIERAILKIVKETKSGTNSAQKDNFPVVYLHQFPYPKYKSEDNAAAYVNFFILPIIVTLMWSGNIGLAIRNLIKEKEKFIEETMRAMGLRPGINWLAWFITTYLAMVFIALIVSLILKYGSIFPETNLGLIFVSLSTFAFSAIMLSFFIGSFFTKTNLASLIGVLAYFVSYLPFILVMSLKYELSFGSKFALCLSAATAFGYSSLYISWYEQQGKGLQLTNIWTSPIPNDTMNFSWTIIIMIMDGIIYGLLGWYVKNVFPSRYGASQPWYFIFTPKFWSSTIFFQIFFPNKPKETLNEYFRDRVSKMDKKHKSKDKFIESDPNHLPIGISLKDLSRKFKGKTAVNNLTLNFFEGQITALLGHNGAGKSTTINVLTGIYAPTSGTAYIYNRDVRYEYDQIRKLVGICPQHDILFDYMTVKEHLIFYGKLKENMSRKELKRDINEMMTKVGLNPYANDFVSSLSGGLRRRLEVAIAFVSGSKTVILDEPTSGVDPYNRMKIWDIILELRAGRTILLTTHYLEEADVLSDRIAIIHQGKLQCCGSSLFLKNKFGMGYILTIDKKLISPSSASIAQSKQLLMEARAKLIDSITQFISRRIHGASLTRQINNTLTFTLPYAQKSNFEDFFIALERNKNALDIASYGISDTTLEEIFLSLTTRDENGDLNTPLNNINMITNKVADNGLSPIQTLSSTIDSDRDSGVAIELGSIDATSNKSSPKQRFNPPKLYQQQMISPSGMLNTSIDSLSQTQLSNNYLIPFRYTKKSGRELYIQQFIALILKRVHHHRRNLRVLMTNLLLPCLFVGLSMTFTAIRPRFIDQPSLEMSPLIYNPNYIFMTVDNTKDPNLKKYSKEMTKSFENVCASRADDYSYDLATNGRQFSKQTLKYLCTLVSADKCALIYQYKFIEYQTQSNIQKTLSIDLAGSNCSVEPYLIETHTDNVNSRFGGITYGDSTIKDDMYSNQSKVIVWFENQAFHSMSSYLHEFYSIYANCLLSNDPQNCNLIDSSKSKSELKLYRIFNHPLSFNNERISFDAIVEKVADIGISLTILCAYSFIPAGFVVYMVRERITQEKRLQYVCGIKPYLYWLSSFVWDYFYYLIIISLTVLIIGAFGSTAYTANSRNFGSLVLLLILFGWSVLPMSYVMSRFFNDTGSAYMIVFCFTLFSGIATCVAVFLLSFLADSNKSIVTTYRVLEKFSLLFPSYSLGSGLIELTKNQIMADAYSIFGINGIYRDPFSLDMLGLKYISLVVTGIIFFLLIVLMEARVNLFPCCKPDIESFNSSRIPEDIDVSQERKRIQNDEANYDILVVKNLTKRYRKATGSRVCAVNNVCFSIPWGHCFGLLGINGAGKTTTFKMITDELKPTFGSRLFNNLEMKEFLKDNIIGYCPQFDAVDEYLTGKEALFIYAKLIGLNEIEQAIVTAINRFKLQSFVDVPIIKYSGGMKRTLSVAVAMLGDPQIVLLDEPTNGMDPEMRRRVWDNILKLIKDDRSVLLTSHSMAECDALCSRLAIMVNGQFVCLGTTQHLKNRFGGGYTLQIKVKNDTALNALTEFVESKFINSILKDKHGTKLEYIIPHKGNNLGKIFGVMESNKENYNITDYSVSQTTLDQVFINFAKSQPDDDSEDEDIEEDIEDSYSNVDQIHEKTNQLEMKVNLPQLNQATNLNSSNNPINSNNLSDPINSETPTFESIKNHFNSLKKSRHIRKTSSAKSQRSIEKSNNFAQDHSLRSRGSIKKKRSSINNGSNLNSNDGIESGFNNLAYEIEYKNSDNFELPIQESFQDLTTSINEDGEYFSKC